MEINMNKVTSLMLLVLIVASLLSVLTMESKPVVITPSYQTDYDEGLYLIDETNVKVLRVPYLHQDGVGHCWLYAAGMIVAYYGGGFDPDKVLNKLHKGFDVGLNSNEIDDLIKAIRELYDIELERQDFKNLVSFKSLVVAEISHGRPIYLGVCKKRWLIWIEWCHAVVVTGYYVLNDNFYLVINDPSGALASYVGATKRFDGSIIKDVENEAYQVLINLNELVKKVEIQLVATVDKHPDPKPPRLTVYPYVLRPYAVVILYEHSSPKHSRYDFNITGFYHNNYEERSLWLPVPIARVGDVMYVHIRVYPNTNKRSSFSTHMEVRYIDIDRNVWSRTHVFTVEIVNASTLRLSCRSNCFGVYVEGERYADVTVPLSLTGVVNISVKAYDIDTGVLEYDWGWFDIHVYDEIVTARPLIGPTVYAGILKKENVGSRKVDLYFHHKDGPWLSVSIIEPETCRMRMTRNRPDPNTGGYYYFCSTEVDYHTKSLPIIGFIDAPLIIPLGFIVAPLIIPLYIEIDLSPAESIYIHLSQVGFKRSENKTTFQIDYCLLDRSIDGQYTYVTVHVLDINKGIGRSINPGTCGSVGLELLGYSTEPLVTIKTRLYSDTKLVSYTVNQVLNPLRVSINNVEVPEVVYPSSYTYISYVLSLPNAIGFKLQQLKLKNLLLLNNTIIEPSVTHVEAVRNGSTNDELLLFVKVFFRVPELGSDSSNGSLVYEVKIYPRFIYDEVLSFSPDLYAYGIMKVRAVTPQTDRFAYVLVLDVSGSMNDEFRGRTKLDWAKEASLILLDLTMDGDYVGVVTFSSDPYVLQEILELNSTTRVLIKDKISSLTAGGSTNIGDSLSLATDMLLNYSLMGYRSTIILLTDGKHNTGTHPCHVLEYVKNSGITVYTIGLGEPGDIDEDVLKTVAASTNGKYYYAPTPDVLRELFLLIRGVGLMRNQIDSITTVIEPHSKVNQTYVLDLSHGDHLLELIWDSGSEPEVYMSFLNTVINQFNASSVGVKVERPALNTLRITIPQNLSRIYTNTGLYSDGMLEVHLIVMNVNPFNVSLKINLFGGREELLSLTIDEETGRYDIGRAVYYKVVAESGSLVIVQLEDSQGVVRYLNFHMVTDDIPIIDPSLEGIIEQTLSPGTYYLKARLYKDGVLRKTVTTPIIITDYLYRAPLSIYTDVKTINGFGNFTAPLTIRAVDNGVINRDIIIVAKLDKIVSNTEQPVVRVEPTVFKLSGVENIATLRVLIPLSSLPGVYNVSFLVIVPGQSAILYKDVVKIVVPRISLSLEGYRDAIIIHNGTTTVINTKLKLTGDFKHSLNLRIKPIIQGVNLLVNDESELVVNQFVNSTSKVDLKVFAKEIGVFGGRLEIYINETKFYSLPLAVVVVPPEADVNKTIWGFGYGRLALGPRGEIDVGIFVDDVYFAAAFISVPKDPRSKFDYIFYITFEPRKSRPRLLLFLNDSFPHTMHIIVEKRNVCLCRYNLSSMREDASIDINDVGVYRVWLEPLKTRFETTAGPLIETTTVTVERTHTVKYEEHLYLYNVALIFLLMVLILATVVIILLSRRLCR